MLLLLLFVQATKGILTMTRKKCENGSQKKIKNTQFLFLIMRKKDMIL